MKKTTVLAFMVSTLALVGCLEDIANSNSQSTSEEAEQEVSDSISTANLYHFWPFDEYHGTLTYDSTRNRVATLLNDAGWSKEGVYGDTAIDCRDIGSPLYTWDSPTSPEDPAIKIAGINENLDLFETGTENFSVSLWVHSKNVIQEYSQHLFGNSYSNAGSGSSSHAAWEVTIVEEEGEHLLQLRVAHKDADPRSLLVQHKIDSGFDNQWHMITVVRSGETMALYVNDEQVGSLNDPNRVGNPEVYADHLPRAWHLCGKLRNWFGSIYFQNGFRGYVDGFSVWDGPLTDQEVSTLYQNPGAIKNQ